MITNIKYNYLQENVLTQDYYEEAPEGYVFKGGIKYILHYYTYQNEWCDRENIKRFKSFDSLVKFYTGLGRAFDA